MKAFKGNNTLSGGKGKDVFFFDIKNEGASGNKDIITDITTGSNQLYLESGTSITAAEISGTDDVIMTLKGGSYTKTLELKGANGKKITVFNADEQLQTSQVYATDTITVANGDGDTIDVSTDYNKGIKFINAKKRSKSVYIISNTNANTIIGGSKADTIVDNSSTATVTNDYYTGGKGNDVFVYYSGNDTISDYALSKNNSDAIMLANGNPTNYSIDGKNVILQFNSPTTNTLTIVNGKDKKLSFLGTDSKAISMTSIAGTDEIFNDYTELTLTKKASQSTAISGTNLDSRVTKIDASKNGQSITIVGNNLASTIKGSSKADSITGGSANDLITSSGGNDTIIMSGGTDTLTDYAAGKDVIALTSGTANPTIKTYF